MRVTDAIKSTAELTGNVVSEATLCRWLSELDGQLMFDFYKGDAFIGYTWDADENAELLVPFPWDGMYINYLEAMVYYSNGEYDRYQNAITQYNKKIDDYRKWLTRKAVPINPALLQGRPIGGTPTTVNFVGKNDTPWYFLSAYALAVKHGYAGTETEWLEAIKGLSAYEVALENGFEGTEEKWLASLVGPPGGVNSFNGRQGDVKPQIGDYTVELLGLASSAQQIDDAVLGNLAATTDCNIDLKAGGNRMLVSRYTNTTLNSPLKENLVTDGVGMVITYAYTTNYGRQICLTGSGGGLCMRHMSGGTISKWDMLTTKSYAVPLDGSKAMTGVLRIEGTGTTSLIQYAGNTTLRNSTDGSNYADIEIRADKELIFNAVTNGVHKPYNILHTGKKPSGSYTGNGSATARTINVGGITSAVLLYSNNGATLVTPSGGILHDGSSVLRAFPWSELHLSDGEIYLATTDIAVNENGKEYYYRAL